MAVSKSEFLNRLSKKELKEIQALEIIIDAKLVADYDGNSVFIVIPNYPHFKVEREIKRRYHQAGWKIIFDIDQIGGSSIELS